MTSSIVIADDHAFTVEGMKSLLEASKRFTVVGAAANGIEAIALIKKPEPDLALLDFTMPEVSGLEAFAEARRWSPNTRFAIITGRIIPARFHDLVEAGIDGIFLKNMSPDDIVGGLTSLLNGEKHIAVEAQQVMDERGQSLELTTRELEVLHAIARGHSNNQIADRLCVSPKTVDSHRTSLMKKMNVHTTASLLVRAMRDGLIDI